MMLLLSVFVRPLSGPLRAVLANYSSDQIVGWLFGLIVLSATVATVAEGAGAAAPNASAADFPPLLTGRDHVIIGCTQNKYRDDDQNIMATVVFRC